MKKEEGRRKKSDMEMTTFPMTVPIEMVRYLDKTEPDHTFERNAMLLYPFIRDLTISHGRAAEILGVSKWHLIEFYDSMGIPYFNQSREELLNDIATLDHVLENAE